MESTDQAIRIPLLEANAELPAREAVLERFKDLVFTRRSAVATPEESAFFAEAELDEPPAPAAIASEFEPALPVELDAFAATPAKYEFLEDSMELPAEAVAAAPTAEWDEESEPAPAASWDEEPAAAPAASWDEEPAPASAASWDEEPAPTPSAASDFDAEPEEKTAAFRWDDAGLAEAAPAALGEPADTEDAGGFDAEPEPAPAVDAPAADFSWNDEDAAAGTFEPEPGGGLAPDEERTGVMAAFDEGAFDEPEPEPEPDEGATAMMPAFDEAAEEAEDGGEGGEGGESVEGGEGGESGGARKRGRRGRGRRGRR